ncbi:MAG: Adenosine deaminase [Candidatus Magasanikbacteria bacterium GW2011_GWA2_56_11]|uniref:adenosine deaminase n=1 Tax=Candidatus Magasanikbacteria bacterium GW2011_GWA2_56_11 TaxID=1619044 RepID=A0A0G1YGH9_9BACT|nr:MAG: Adenosine deaminase [Candidatus Magasanikbacteria bacterium GW2011_GWA2_56_11]
MTTTLTREEIFRLPKTDLHRHLDGAVQPELVIKLAKQLGVKLPTYDLAEFTKLYQITEPKGMPIDQLFQRFAWAIAVMRTPQGLCQAAYEQVLDLARENILYAEIRFAPGYHGVYPAPWYKPTAYEEPLFPIMSLENAVINVLSGLASGIAETGIEVNLTLCIPRESLFAHGPKSVADIAKLAVEFQDWGIVAIDLACDELSHSPYHYAQAFRSTIGSRIRRNPHAGEMGVDAYRLDCIQACITQLHADGLGHALPIWQSDYLMAWARTKNIRIERTPLSPVDGCSLADGHLDVLLDYKVPVVITSDDPVLMRASLTDNWLAALNYHNFGAKEFWQLTANAVNHGFFRSAAQKKRVQQLFVKQGLDRSLLMK